MNQLIYIKKFIKIKINKYLINIYLFLLINCFSHEKHLVG